MPGIESPATKLLKLSCRFSNELSRKSGLQRMVAGDAGGFSPLMLVPVLVPCSKKRDPNEWPGLHAAGDVG